jgi:hypothetical protein
MCSRTVFNTFGEGKNLLSLSEFKPQIITPVTWSLYALCYLDSTTLLKVQLLIVFRSVRVKHLEFIHPSSEKQVHPAVSRIMCVNVFLVEDDFGKEGRLLFK